MISAVCSFGTYSRNIFSNPTREKKNINLPTGIKYRHCNDFNWALWINLFYVPYNTFF